MKEEDDDVYAVGDLLTDADEQTVHGRASNTWWTSFGVSLRALNAHTMFSIGELGARTNQWLFHWLAKLP